MRRRAFVKKLKLHAVLLVIGAALGVVVAEVWRSRMVRTSVESSPLPGPADGATGGAGSAGEDPVRGVDLLHHGEAQGVGLAVGHAQDGDITFVGELDHGTRILALFRRGPPTPIPIGVSGRIGRCCACSRSSRS